MTIGSEDELEKLKVAGRVVARTLKAMGEALEPGITTRELDDIGRRLLELDGARSAPELTYGFPGATCISIGPDVAHGIPDDRKIAAGDLVNIDVSAEVDGFFGDTGASFAVPPVSAKVDRLCRDGRRALWTGIRAVRPGASLNAPGRSIEAFARKNGYSLVRNLASHGVGGALHEAPTEIATWPTPPSAARSPRAWSSPWSPSCPWAPTGSTRPATAGRCAPWAASPPSSTNTRWSPPGTAPWC